MEAVWRLVHESLHAEELFVLLRNGDGEGRFLIRIRKPEREPGNKNVVIDMQFLYVAVEAIRYGHGSLDRVNVVSAEHELFNFSLRRILNKNFFADDRLTYKSGVSFTNMQFSIYK